VSVRERKPEPDPLETGRSVRRWEEGGFTPYTSSGTEVIEGLSWIPLDFDKQKGIGSYYLQFAPGASSRLHCHSFDEQFYMLAGELVEPDGRVLRAGDHVLYAAGTVHRSHSPKGCTMLVWLKGWNNPQHQPVQEH